MEAPHPNEAVLPATGQKEVAATVDRQIEALNPILVAPERVQLSHRPLVPVEELSVNVDVAIVGGGEEKRRSVHRVNSQSVGETRLGHRNAVL